MKKDKRIDEYISKAQPFAQPILKRLRKLVHKACPDTVETIKWGFASFEYKGPFCTMAAFKNHCVFGFWKASLLKDPDKVLGERANNGGEAMGHLGRITSLKDLPADSIIIDFIKQAAKLNDEGIKLPARKAVSEKEKKALEIPEELTSALKRNVNARKTFESFSYSNKKDYCEWISEAKTKVTLEKRLATTMEWLSEGKTRHWKYKSK